VHRPAANDFAGIAEMPTVVYTNPTSVPVAFVGKKNLVVVEVLFQRGDVVGFSYSWLQNPSAPSNHGQNEHVRRLTIR
jgi:hypothetical protein